jgi:predicted dehydrogenase
MDGTMFVHHNRTHDLVTLVQDEDRVGKADRVEATFSFQGNDDFFKTNIRASAEGDPLGCIGDLGWYCVRLALLVFPTKPISAQVVDCKLNDEGVPINASCFVHFDDNRLLAFHCGFLTPLRQTAVICGSKAIVSLDDFVLPFGAPLHFELHSQSLTQYDLITRDDKVIFEADTGPVQEVLMWQKFAKLAKVVGSVDIASTCCWAGENQEFQEANDLAVTTLVNQSVMHALMQSIASGGSKVNI